MSALHDEESLLDELGAARLGENEWALRSESQLGQRPAQRPSSCPPVAARPAVDRCLNPGTLTCPAIPNLLCLREVGGVPFEYPTLIRRDPTTRLAVVRRRQSPRTQRFIPSVRDALLSFMAMMARFSMPIEAILTAGSLYCRCIRGTNVLSNHSFGDAIDIVGVRWPPVGGPTTRLRETIVHNWADPGERAPLRRINAVLRMSFATVIDYHRSDHRDHFHCDMNRGRGRRLRGRQSLVFVQEALGVVLGRRIPVTGRWDAATRRALSEFSGTPATALERDDQLNLILGRLFARVAAGG